MDNLNLHEGITKRNALKKELLSNIMDTQINFTTPGVQKYHKYTLLFSEATRGTSS